MLPETLVNEVIKQICKSLASFDLKTRNKGFKRLQKVITFCNTGTYKLELDHCLLLWKGLHYWLWSQDKLINQERLVNDICHLLPTIKVPKTKFEFISAFFETEVREWRTLDKWRTDKFMMLVRRFFRQILTEVSEDGWADVDKLVDLLRLYLISSDNYDPAFGLRLHFSTIYLEEIFRFEVSSEVWLKFLTPYFKLISFMTRDNSMLKRVEDMFFLILPPTEEEEDEQPLNINFGDLGRYLYQLGGAGGKNVKKLYEWATICFRIAGIPPPSEPLPTVSPPVKAKAKRKRKMNSEVTQESVALSSPPRKRRKIESISPSNPKSPSQTDAKKVKLSTVQTKEKSRSPSTSSYTDTKKSKLSLVQVKEKSRSPPTSPSCTERKKAKLSPVQTKEESRSPSTSLSYSGVKKAKLSHIQPKEKSTSPRNSPVSAEVKKAQLTPVEIEKSSNTHSRSAKTDTKKAKLSLVQAKEEISKSPSIIPPKLEAKKGKDHIRSPKTPTVTPHGKGKNKRVSFGKIYRKPFKKKDAVKTPSPGTITASSASKGILKKNLFGQSKKLGLLFFR